MKKWMMRLIYGLLFALPLVVAIFALTRVTHQARAQAQPPQQELDCALCHQTFHDVWKDSAHGKAMSDPTFEAAWRAKGQSGECLNCHVTGYDPLTNTWQADGVACQACHSPAPKFHPEDPMPTDRSANLCGRCHTEAHFEWQASVHREKGIDCASCHTPHSTSLKADNPTQLCASCHNSQVSNYTHSTHSLRGLTCIDCHLSQEESELGEGHARLDHSFFVSLSTCTQCHAYQMHEPVGTVAEATPIPPDSMASASMLVVSTEPIPISPLGFAVLAILIGIAFGVVLAPWLERFQGRSRKPREGEDEGE